MLLSEWRVLFGDEDMRLQLHSAEKTQIILTWKIFREIILLLVHYNDFTEFFYGERKKLAISTLCNCMVSCL